MFVAVAEAEPEELVGMAGDESHGVAGLDIAVVGFDEENGVELAVGHIIAFKPHAVLLAVDFGDIEIDLVGIPADVGEVVPVP